jgi:transposase
LLFKEIGNGKEVEVIYHYYESLTKALDNDPPLDVRIDLWHLAREMLRLWIGKEYVQ